MVDFTWFLDWWPTIVSGLAGLAVSFVAYLRFRVKIKIEKEKNKVLSDALAEARYRDTYTVCPSCKAEVKLKDLHWYLPGGQCDDNLNGVPDHQE